MNRKKSFSDFHIGPDFAPFIIAEMSGNHNGSLDRALSIVDAAAASGVQAVKLQTYTADTLTLESRAPQFMIDNPESPWHGRSLHDLYQEAHTPWEWHAAIFERAKQAGLLCFSSPFDASAVDFLEQLDTPMYKVASFEIVDLPLIRKIAATGKPMIISTGLATVGEIDAALNAAREAGSGDVMILKCTSSYPAPAHLSNLRTIENMRDTFQVEVGLSDHTAGIGAAVAAVALGATVIEKHVTLSREEGGVDAMFSLEPPELRLLVNESRRAWEALGKIQYGGTAEEQASLVFRRSLYVTEDLKAGAVLTEKNLRSIRPGYGLPPDFFDVLLGKRVNRDLKRGTAMSWEYIA